MPHSLRVRNLSSALFGGTPEGDRNSVKRGEKPLLRESAAGANPHLHVQVIHSQA
ncbi:hypothetical protein GCM10010339_55560 [Streptomyces alanosinicus]|uniref:Uncharacterized protein n=1 Tax=Streptomyces alanosinicus TaxID=68171 RepID=A0A918YLE2_9ACTN|nr:hypothetical protein GCM10010339_55560 [Streptomyces alanosinicus]